MHSGLTTFFTFLIGVFSYIFEDSIKRLPVMFSVFSYVPGTQTSCTVCVLIAWAVKNVYSVFFYIIGGRGLVYCLSLYHGVWRFCTVFILISCDVDILQVCTYGMWSLCTVFVFISLDIEALHIIIF